MDWSKNAVLLVMLATPLAAQAIDPLSCRVEQGTLSGASGDPEVIEFTWSTAHETADPTGPIETAIGRIDQVEGPRFTTALTLNGRPLSLPAELQGLIRFGTVYDYGDRVAMAYLVERADDSSASPSQVVVVLGKDGSVDETEVLAGNAPTIDGHCILIQ